MSYLTDAEAMAIPSELLPGPPVLIRNTSKTLFGQEDQPIGGHWYSYVAATDELIRTDVFAWVNDRRANKTKEATQ